VLSKKIASNINLSKTDYYNNQSSQTFNVGLSQQISKKMTLSLYGSHSKDRKGRKDGYQFKAGQLMFLP